MATSSTEVAERVATCLTDLGWEVELSGNGFVADIPDDQREPFNRDAEQCQVDTNSVIPELDNTEELAKIEYAALEDPVNTFGTKSG